MCIAASARVSSSTHIRAPLLGAQSLAPVRGEKGYRGNGERKGKTLTETALSLRARKVKRMRIYLREVRRIRSELLAQARERGLHRGERVCPESVAVSVSGRRSLASAPDTPRLIHRGPVPRHTER